MSLISRFADGEPHAVALVAAIVIGGWLAFCLLGFIVMAFGRPK